MQLKRLVSEGLAHNSYIVADSGQAVVIDPGRDLDRYLQAAAELASCITLIFETHRHEDFISGASELAKRTGAKVWRGVSPDYEVPYAAAISDGQKFAVGALRLTALATPGHTDDSISLALVDTSTGNATVAVFTGDALFVGDVGRTDFYPDRAEEVAGMLYDSLHKSLLPLGDQCAIYPAHGNGSVCGAGIAKREFSTFGAERLDNNRLRLKRDAFVRAKVDEHHYTPPYFKQMESANVSGRPAPALLPRIQALETPQLNDLLSGDTQLLDLRSAQAIAGANIQFAYSIPLAMLASFGGWFLDARRPIALLLEQPADVEIASLTLLRIGYDKIAGFVAGGIIAWATAGHPVQSLAGIDVFTLRDLLASRHRPRLLDVRSIDEFEAGHIEQAEHLYVGHIENFRGQLDAPVVCLCQSGQRALVAAAALARMGHRNVSVCWGSMAAWKAAQFPTVEG